jgi:hypothetical protein
MPSAPSRVTPNVVSGESVALTPPLIEPTPFQMAAVFGVIDPDCVDRLGVSAGCENQCGGNASAETLQHVISPAR